MPDATQAGLIFLLTTVFDLYLFVLVIRLILVWSGANYFNPLTQFIVKLTDFIIKPLRRYIPNFHGIELSSILVIFSLEICKFFLITAISYGLPNILGILILATSDFLKMIMMSLFYAIILQVILSWIQPHSPINHILYKMTYPIMRPLHRVIPPVAGFDITPIPVLIGLQFLIIILINPLMALGFGIATH